MQAKCVERCSLSDRPVHSGWAGSGKHLSNVWEMTVEGFGKKQSACGETICHARVKQLREEIKLSEKRKYGSASVRKSIPEIDRGHSLSMKCGERKQTTLEGFVRKAKDREKFERIDQHLEVSKRVRPDKSLRERLFKGSSWEQVARTRHGCSGAQAKQ